MALDDWQEDVMEETEEDEQEDSGSSESGSQRLSGIETLLKDKALQYEGVEVEDGEIKGDTRKVAMIFALMCLDVEEADLPKP